MFIKKLRKQVENIERDLENIQINEVHCINARRDLTDYELSVWKAAYKDYKQSLIKTVNLLTKELETVISEQPK